MVHHLHINIVCRRADFPENKTHTGGINFSPLQCGHSNHERYGFIFTLFSLYFSLILIFFSELANHSRESMQRSRLFSSLFSKWRHDFKQRRRHFSKFFPIFYQSWLFRFFTIAGYSTNETIKALSDANITTFFIQKQGTNETYLFRPQT